MFCLLGCFVFFGVSGDYVFWFLLGLRIRSCEFGWGEFGEGCEGDGEGWEGEFYFCFVCWWFVELDGVVDIEFIFWEIEGGGGGFYINKLLKI